MCVLVSAAEGTTPADLGIAPTPPEERLVGLAYTNWHGTGPWQGVWGEPELGFYSSLDRDVIRKHAEWIADAGVDFVWVDWSNNVSYVPGSKPESAWERIEQSTAIMFEEYAKLDKRPKISIFIGVTGAPESVSDGRLHRKADQVYEMYVANPKCRPLVQDYLGKPLLVIYTDTPCPWQGGPPDWDDDRFTVRWMTGFITEQPNLRTEDRVSKHGYWSWEDRGPQTVTIHDGHAESMVVVASWRKQGEPGTDRYVAPGLRRNGKTFRDQWARARAFGPHIVTVVSWNEWVLGEQPSAENSKDLEPSKEFGHMYLDLLAEEIAKFKARRSGL
jgi:hypothetical protein